MADISDRIIILSALLLVMIILSLNSGPYRTLVTVNDVDIEIVTPRDYYTLGENFTANLYFENNGTRDVWMNPMDELPFFGRSINDPEPDTGVTLLHWPHGHMIRIPAKSKITFFERDYEPKFSGEFIITCLGANKTVLILDSESEGAIQIGRYFLDGVGRKTGRVLFIKHEEKEPNFYWDTALKSDVEWDRLDVWDRMLKWDRPEIREIRPCWVIRFEQAKRPGHFYEVWLDASEYIVVGGSSCK